MSAINVLFAARPERWAQYEASLVSAFHKAGLDVSLRLDHPPAETDYVIYAPNSWLQDFAPYTRTKAVLSLWAGVETIVGNTTLTQPLCRMVDPSLTQGMVEWVTGHVLRHHLGMDEHITAEPGTWNPVAPPVAWDRKITVLGLGELGVACATSLASLGFDVHGWSRSPKSVDSITCHDGKTGLKGALRDAHGVVLLLPETTATENVLNASTFSLLAAGAFVLNPGRGRLIDDQALLNALDKGQIGHATLDVFRTEPLPAEHAFWHHPNVTITPHIASETRAEWASTTIAKNIARSEQDLSLLHLVDRALGY